MKKNLSVLAYINILFTFVLSLLIVAIILFIAWDKERMKSDEMNRYKLIANNLLSSSFINSSEDEIQKFYETFYIHPVILNEHKELILQKGKVIFKENYSSGNMQMLALGKAEYIYLSKQGYDLLLEDTKPDNIASSIIFLISFVIALLFAFLYIAIIKKLAPLKSLHKQIAQFASGDMEIKITHKSDDEIGAIAKSFDDAIEYIRKLLASKNLFMRNMMHELKTPITKGRIAVEMIEDGKNKMVLIGAFERMNQLISELAHVERLSTQQFQPQLKNEKISSIIAKSQKMLLCDKSQIVIKGSEERVISTDANLLALALKNLIDNAIKYSKEHQAIINVRLDSIQIISKGEPLKHSLKYYLEPFTQENKQNSGFGLGLYIVNNVAKRLGYALYYRHENKNNIFELLGVK
ncbi:MAG: hypothetical protein KN64_06640 [Sulfurovum sp. AS07-7]|nr:MAG: hypothetical protein KN64_06640 [Sulfurovum sp. AS07-7]